MRLDAHHSFSEHYPLSTLATILKRNRFEGSILVAAAVDFEALPEFVRAVVIETDVVDPRRLDEYQRHPLFRGLCCRMTAGPPEHLDELERRGLSLDVQGGLEWVPQIAGQFPALRMAIVHLGSPKVDHTEPADWERWAAALDAAARIPQVCCKLSGLTGLATSPWRAEDLRPYVHHALAVFGPDRLMFGSGWPAQLPEHAWKESLAAFTQAIGARSMEVREQLLGATAARSYQIG